MTATKQSWNLAWFSAAGSNIFSNVPFVLVAGKWIPGFANPELMWKVMALATTFAGNLTLLGSVANIIVVESARGHIEVGYRYADFARDQLACVDRSLFGRGVRAGTSSSLARFF